MSRQNPVELAERPPPDPIAPAGDDWTLCDGCHGVFYGRRWARALRVCPDCGRHAPVGALERLHQLLDGGWTQLDTGDGMADPLDFADTRPYRDRLADARRRTGLAEAAVGATGTVDGHSVVAVAMDFRFLGGSLGAAVGELITRAGEAALRTRTPLLLVTASGGARMQEGAVSLMQMAKTSQMLGQLDAAGVLTLSVVTDPTFGGVAASFASLCDVVLAEPGARLGFAGPRVIRQTLGQTLPAGFQTAEFLAERGLIDGIRPRRELRATLSRVLAVAARTRTAPALPPPGPPVVTDPDLLRRREAWDVVREARKLDRPTTLDYVHRLVEDFVELRGDRQSGDCPAVVGGVGRLEGRPVVVVGHQKGHVAAELSARNYGMPVPAGYRKAARLFRLAAKLGLAVVTLVDTPGAYPGVEAEEQGQAMAIAENLRLMAGLPVPVITVVTGEGGSGGALALAVADRVLICANAVYSVISPEGCAAILWNDPAAAPAAAAALRLQPADLLRLGVVDGVVPEPPGGAGADHAAAAGNLRAALASALVELSALGPNELVARRWARFRRFGAALDGQTEGER